MNKMFCFARLNLLFFMFKKNHFFDEKNKLHVYQTRLIVSASDTCCFANRFRNASMNSSFIFSICVFWATTFLISIGDGCNSKGNKANLETGRCIVFAGRSFIFSRWTRSGFFRWILIAFRFLVLIREVTIQKYENAEKWKNNWAQF